MEALRNALLIAGVGGVFVLGFFLVRRIDRFLYKNRQSIEKEDETEEPSCVVLAEDMSDEEITGEINRFRKRHGGARVVLYDVSVKGEAPGDGNREGQDGLR